MNDVSLLVLIFFAGLPTIVAYSGTSFSITVFAPILAPLPIVIGPNICAPEPIITSSETVGCLLTSICYWEFSAGEIHPKVTPW